MTVDAITARTRQLPRWLRQPALPILVGFVTSRALIAATIWMSRSVIHHGPYWRGGGIRGVLVQWDGFWYLNIVRHGYTFSTHHQSGMGFFPLYPLLTKAFSYIVPFEPADEYAAIILSNLCLIVACFLLYELTRIDSLDSVIPRLAVMFLLFSPVSFFFSGAYAESLFLMFTTGAILAALRERWLIASLLGMGAAATRHIGILILLPLVVEYVRQRHRAGERLRATPQALSLLLVPMAFVLFLTYGYLRFNDFLAYFQASRQWGRRFTTPIATFQSADYGLLYKWLFFGLLAGSVALVVIGARLKLRASYLIYAGALILAYVCSGTMEAMPRLLSVVFPLFIVMALISTRYNGASEPLFAVSVGLLGLCTVVYANGYWLT